MPAGQRNKNMHNNTECKFHYRRDLMISAIMCGGKKYTYISSVPHRFTCGGGRGGVAWCGLARPGMARFGVARRIMGRFRIN